MIPADARCALLPSVRVRNAGKSVLRCAGGIRHCRTGCAGVCFESIVVSGAEAVQASRMGMYRKVPNLTQGDRPVYRLGADLSYLFYWPTTSEWRIGSNYTSNSSGVKSTNITEAACPDHVNGWQAYSGGAWVSTYTITVAPSTTSSAPTNSTPTPGISAARKASHARMRRLTRMRRSLRARCRDKDVCAGRDTHKRMRAHMVCAAAHTHVNTRAHLGPRMHSHWVGLARCFVCARALHLRHCQQQCLPDGLR
jgi:hypothetical protein